LSGLVVKISTPAAFVRKMPPAAALVKSSLHYLYGISSQAGNSKLRRNPSLSIVSMEYPARARIVTA
jgi:hypothetical protein